MRRTNKGYATTYIVGVFVWVASAVLIWMIWGRDLAPPGDLSRVTAGLFRLHSGGWSTVLDWLVAIPADLSALGSALLDAGYARPIAASLLPGALLFAVIMAHRRASWRTLADVPLGCVFGLGVGIILNLWVLPSGMSPVLAPGALLLAGGAFPQMFPPSIPDTEVLRGPEIVPVVTNSKKVTEKALKYGTVIFAGVPVAFKAEVGHFLTVGKTGAGKSVAQRQTMSTAMARGDQAVVADPDGSAMALFWRPGDVLLNPFDARSGKWDILGEISKASDYAHLAVCLLPASGSAENAQWTAWARDVFAACLKRWHQEELGSSDEFLAVMATASTAKLGQLCEGTAAQRYFAPGGEKMLAGMLSGITPLLGDLENVTSMPGRPFSVRQWMRGGKGTLWLPYQADQVAALARLVSCWMRLGLEEVQTWPDSETRRVWFIIDELDAIGRIEGLKGGLVRLRKKGGCVVMGTQSTAQVDFIYGEADAKTMVEQANTQLILRCGASGSGGGTARFASDLIGDREVAREEVSIGLTEGQHTSSTTSSHIRRQMERAVLPSEIGDLPDNTGYLKRLGQPWVRVAYQWADYPARVAAFVPAALDGAGGS